MSKKHDFLRKEQNRDKNPDKMMKGSAAQLSAEQMRAQAKGNPADHQLPRTPKLANDHNKMGNKEPTQKNEGQRTPESRHDRQTTAGAHNIIQARTGGKGAGRGPRGGGSVGGGNS